MVAKFTSRNPGLYVARLNSFAVGKVVKHRYRLYFQVLLAKGAMSPFLVWR
jgi:hypothetical protein